VADMGALISLNRAPVRPWEIDGRLVASAIGKRGVDGPVPIRPSGVMGDEQADPTVHGGLAKALYAYPQEHYAFWQTVRAQARVAGWEDALPPGSLGENLTLTGLLEDQAWIGDVLRFPNCELAVSEPRMPCFKFNAAMGFKQASALMLTSGWCGFYLSVRVPGSLQAGETFDVVAGPREVGIRELFLSRAAPRQRGA